MDTSKIITDFNTNLSSFFGENDTQRDEIYRSFAYMDGHQVDDKHEAVEANSRRRTKPNINMSSAIVRAVAGSDAMQDRHIDIAAVDNDDYNIDADIMADCVDYAQHVSMYKSNRAVAVRDVGVCGLGATVSYLDMARRDVPSGVPSCSRKYPGFLFYDNSGRGGDLNTTAMWCGYADPMRLADLQDYVERKTKDRKKADGHNAMAGAADFAGLFLSNLHLQNSDLTMLYHYFWRDFVPVYDVKNPLAGDGEEQTPMAQLISQDDIAIELLAAFVDEHNLDMDAPYWTMDEDDYKEFDKVIKDIVKVGQLDYQVEKSSRVAYCYYRAELGMGELISHSKSYSQECYPLNFITGYYDEALGHWYGLMRPLSEVQDQLNHVMEDLIDYSRTAASGGKIYLKKVGDKAGEIIKDKLNEKDVTLLPEEAEVIQKQLAQTPQVLLETARLLLELLPRCVGVGQEFLGVITTGTMTDSLYGKVMKQSYAVLEDFTNSVVGYSRRQGVLFRDMMIGIARAEEGRILPVLSPGHPGDSYIRITKDNMAREYVIRVTERPTSEDEKNEMVKVLTQLLPAFQGAGMNVMPVMIDSLPLDENQKMELKESIPKPQPPNPMDQQAMEANIRLLNAQSLSLETNAKKTIDTLRNEDEKLVSEIDKNVAMAQKYTADAMAGAR